MERRLRNLGVWGPPSGPRLSVWCEVVDRLRVYDTFRTTAPQVTARSLRTLFFFDQDGNEGQDILYGVRAPVRPDSEVPSISRPCRPIALPLIETCPITRRAFSVFRQDRKDTKSTKKMWKTRLWCTMPRNLRARRRRLVVVVGVLEREKWERKIG
jgi:hypothetical protein